ncbi:MAG: hypothetical protein AB1664_00770 [Thermodesulfobacteriota bacterium]
MKEIALSFFSRNLDNIWYSGVVIAGYGKRDLFPGLTSFITEGSFNRKLKWHLDEQYFMDYDIPPTVIPFAQGETVRTFMNGIDTQILDAFYEFLGSFTTNFAEIAVQHASSLTRQQQATLKQDLTDAGKRAAENFQQGLEGAILEKYVEPIVAALNSIPKDELAVVAESLVSLTSFRQRISIGTETVGGPVDVAVITKGDGFVWIKRKEYFDANINHGFFVNYFRQPNGGGP